MTEITDHGAKPLVVNIREAALKNTNFRTALWTGKHIQVTLMSIPVGGDVGLELHHHEDQLLRIEQGSALVEMGPEKDEVTFKQEAGPGSAILVPVGVWHNIINTGTDVLKLYSVYGPPHHDKGTVHETQADDHGHDH